MIYNLKIAYRNLRRNGVYSVINIIGLTVSLLACILITMWVQDELSYDRFHKDSDRIYRVHMRMQGNDDYFIGTPAPLAASISSDVPDIEEYCRIGEYSFNYLDYNNMKFRNINGLAVDTSFFKMFSFPLITGNTDNHFPDDLSIIVSETLAKKLFGDDDPIGKMVTAETGFTFHVTAIMKDFPDNSSLKADYLVRFDVQQRTYSGNNPWSNIEDDWGNCWYYTFLKLSTKSNLSFICEKASKKFESVFEDIHFNLETRLQPLHELHLYASDGQPDDMKKVYIFSLIAILIMGIACINYINLVTARSSKRGKEIAVRKIMGAKKPSLLQQFMNDTVILLLISFFITFGLLDILLPYFNELSGKNLHFTFNTVSVLTFLSIALITLLVAGIYPACVLSSFNPLDIFRVELKKKAALFRKVLVVLQFTVSISLIIVTIAITLQLRYMHKLDPGYNKENIITINTINIGSHYQTVKKRLSEDPSILDVSASGFKRMWAGSRRGDVWKNEETGQWPVFRYSYIDNGFFSFMNIPIVEGREFHYQLDNYWNQGVIINETAAKLIGGGQSVVGMKIMYNNSIEIIGVVKDFNFLTFKEEMQPLIIWYDPVSQPYLYVKVAPGNIKGAIAAIEEVWKEYNSDYDFQYSFLDDDFDKVYKSDIRINKIFSIFALIAVFVSCLGLFGLITYTAETKTKEIGIRKVYGASVRNIVEMLSKEFLILVGIGMLIAFPISYFWLDNMLQDYPYHIAISWWIFALAAVITVALTLLTVGVQALRAATRDPIKSISST